MRNNKTVSFIKYKEENTGVSRGGGMRSPRAFYLYVLLHGAMLLINVFKISKNWLYFRIYYPQTYCNFMAHTVQKWFPHCNTVLCAHDMNNPTSSNRDNLTAHLPRVKLLVDTCNIVQTKFASVPLAGLPSPPPLPPPLALILPLCSPTRLHFLPTRSKLSEASFIVWQAIEEFCKMGLKRWEVRETN